MGFLGLGKKKEDLDLTEGYRRKYKLTQEQKQITSPSNSSDSFEFLGNVASSVSTNENEDELNSEEKRKRLAKRLMDMTDKIEDLSNQIYHLTQRMELVERKLSILRSNE